MVSKVLHKSSATAHVAPDLLKTLTILSDKTIWRYAVDQEDLKLYWIWEKKANVTDLNRGTSVYLPTLLGIFDILTQQEIVKRKPYICQSNCLNIAKDYC